MDIWVGLDASVHADHALVWASRIPSHATANVIHPVMSWHIPALATISATGVPSSDTMFEATELSAQKVVDRVRSRLHSTATLAEPEIHVGEPSHCLLELAQPTDLIVVGSRGLGGFGSLILGSVSSRLAVATRCPLAIIPSAWQPEWPTANDIVVGVDGTESATAAALWALRTFPDASIQLTHAWKEPTLAGFDALAYDIAETEVDAQNLLDRTAASLRAATDDPERITTRLVHGDARHVLLAHGQTNDLLVIGRQLGHAARRILGGSVAHSVTHHLSSPTVIVPA